MKLKRTTTVPLLLLVYLIAVSIYAWPGRNPGLSYLQYGLTIGITLICIIALSYFLKKRDTYRDKNKPRNGK